MPRPNYRSPKIRKRIVRDQDERRDELKQLESVLHAEWRQRSNEAVQVDDVSQDKAA